MWPPIMENQMENKLENEMDPGIIQLIIGIRGYLGVIWVIWGYIRLRVLGFRAFGLRVSESYKGDIKVYLELMVSQN